MRIAFQFRGDWAWRFQNPEHLLELPKDTWDEFKWFLQRGWRGYADTALWSLDHYLSEMLVSAIKQLKETKYGYPEVLRYDNEGGKCSSCGNSYFQSCSCSLLVWNEYLNKMIAAFQAVLDDEADYTKDGETFAAVKARMDARTKIMEEGLTLFSKYFRALWD